MPLSDPTSLYLTDLARRRAQAEALRQSSEQASQMGIGVLQKKQADDTAAAQHAQEQAIRLRQLTDTETQQAVENERAQKQMDNAQEQAKQAYRLSLSNNDAAALRTNLEHFDAQRNADAERAIRLRQVADTEGAEKFTQTRQTAADALAAKGRALSAAVAAADPGASGFVDADALAKISAATGATPEEVKQAAQEAKAAAAKAAFPREQLEAENKRAANANATQMAIAKMNADQRATAAAEKVAGAGGKLTPADEKRRSEVQDIEARREAIKRNVADLKAQIDRTGTFEATGPENSVMEEKMTEIATDLAKLEDPQGVARSEKIKLYRKDLIPEGALGKLTMSNETAKKVLDSAGMQADRRADEAYKIRGVPKEDGGRVGAPAPPMGAAPAAAGDFVIVTDGKETLKIPRVHLADAQADGFTEVP